MASHFIEPTQILAVEHLPILIYGPPGSGKTSMAQTAAKPVTLDFDQGIHRAFNRGPAFRFDTWSDCLTEQRAGSFGEFGTLVIDTLGALLDAMAKEIMAESAKNALGGGLSISGWGVLGNRFSQWIRQAIKQGQDVLLVCHEDEDKDVAGNRYVRPAMPGKMAYSAVHRCLDIIGHVSFAEGTQRVLEFSPTNQAIGKNAPGWSALPVPDLARSKTFMADLFADAKSKIGRTAEASAAAAAAVQQWVDWLKTKPDLDGINARLPDLATLVNGTKKQVWQLICDHAFATGCFYVAAEKKFARKEVAA